MFFEEFEAKVRDLKHIKLPENEDIQAKFLAYFNILVEENEKYNLTAITEKNDVYLKHFYDSVLLLNYFDLSNKRVLDIGSGAGFPGIPLAICCKTSTFFLCEPTTKRAKFLELVKEKLGLDNVVVINKRAEDLDDKYRDYFDVVTSRAVSALNIIAELSVPFVKVNSYFIPFKGSIASEEIKNSKNAFKVLNIVLEKEESYTLDQNQCRTLIFFRKTKKTLHKYPRNYSIIKQRPL